MLIIRALFSCNKFHLLTTTLGTRHLSDLSSPSLKTIELYELAVEKLNLMSNAVIRTSNLNRNEDDDDPYRNINDTKKLLECIGITVDDLSKLKIIHVAGTKGKGSTCVLTEQLLKSLGLKTGFYSSPHMFKVNERIRINGVPISDDLFARHFWQIYWPAMRQHAHDSEYNTPEYFNFLTAMAYHIFLAERVDVAIVEAGFGGQYDATNLFSHTRTAGITTLLFDQTNTMGYTMADVAWDNSGIIKNKSNVFTNEQSPECMEVIRRVAHKCNANLQIVPKFDDYKWNTPVKPKLTSNVQKLTISQAIQLAYSWIRSYKDAIPRQILDKVDFLFFNPEHHCPTDVPNQFINPLETCYWPGRYQILNLDNKTIYFDCGHNCESIKISTEWFQDCIGQNRKPICLIFSATDDPNFVKSLTIIYNRLQLDLVYFTPNYPYANPILNHKSAYSRGQYEGQLSNCYDLAQAWSDLQKASLNFRETKVVAMPCISSCFDKFNEIYKKCQIDVLVIGPLNMVGETLKYLNQNKLY